MSEHRQHRPSQGPTAPYSKRYVPSRRAAYRRWVAPAVVIGLVGLIVALSTHEIAALVVAVVLIAAVIVAYRR
jgi:hypothetical protein